MINIIKTGDWTKAAEILNSGIQLKKAIHWAVEREAHEAKRRMVKGITAQEPGGQKFLPLKAITLIMRKANGFGGTKALIVTGQLRNSITVRSVGPGVVFVGVLRNSKRADGKSLYNIARVHELGATITMRMTPKMFNFLMRSLRKAGYGGFARDWKVKFHKSMWKVTGSSRRVIVIKIPPRPFVQPVIEEMFKNPREVQDRLAKRIAIRMKLMLGKV